MTADGALVLEVYYDLNYFTLTIIGDTHFSQISATGAFMRSGNFEDATKTFTAEVLYTSSVTIGTPQMVIGYEFDSWTSSDVTLTANSFTMPAGNVTVNGTSKARTFTITFEGNGGTAEGDGATTSYTQTFEYLETANLTDNRFINAGYTFSNWTITINEVPEEFDDGDSFTFNYLENLTAVANWTANTNTAFTIVVSVQDKDGTTNEKEITLTGTTGEEITEEDALDALIEALQDTAIGDQIENEHLGFTFGGFGEQDLTINGDGSTEITVSFTRNTISYNFEIGTGVDRIEVSYTSADDFSTQQFTYSGEGENSIETVFGTDITITAHFADGYVFGAFTEEDSDSIINTWTEEDIDANTLTTNSGTESGHTFTVESETDVYNVIYHDNFKETDATNSTQEVHYLASFTLTAVSRLFTHTGYTFTGWALEAEGEEVEYADMADIPAYTWTEDLNLYAVWSANSYTINFSSPNSPESESMDPISTRYDVLTELTENIFTREGYYFVGWALSSGGESVVQTVATVSEINLDTDSGVFYVEDEQAYYAYNLTSDVDGEETLYPVWETVYYNIVLHANEDDTITPVRLKHIAYEELYTIPAFTDSRFTDFVNEGFVFAGWYREIESVEGEPTRQDYPLDETETLEVSKLTLNNNEDVHFYVIWSAGEVDVRVKIVLQSTKGEYDEEIVGNVIDVDDIETTAETDTVINSQYIYDNFISGSRYDSMEGFHYDSSEQDSQTVSYDGTTEIRVYFARERYNIYISIGTGIESAEIATDAFHLKEELEEGEEGYLKYSAYFGDSVTFTATPIAGYNTPVFMYSGSPIEGGVLASMPAEDVYVTVTAQPNTNTPFNIEIYLADENGEYVEAGETTYRTTGTGTTDAPIDTASARRIVESYLQGQSVNLSLYVTDGEDYADDNNIISADGSTTIRFYYDRQTYLVSFASNSPAGLEQVPENTSYRWGSEVSVEVEVSLGYSLNSFTATDEEGEPIEDLIHQSGTNPYTITFTMPTNAFTININISANTNTSYTVVYRFRTADGSGFEEGMDISITKQGTTDALLTEDMIGYVEGMTVSERPGYFAVGTSLTETPAYIAGDGSTVVYIYFARQDHKLTLSLVDANSGILTDTIEVRLDGTYTQPISSYTYNIYQGQQVQISFEMMEGFTFVGFEIDNTNVTDELVDGQTLTFTAINDDVEVTITVTPRLVNYAVNYYLETEDGSYTRLPWDANSIGNERLQAEANEYMTELGRYNDETQEWEIKSLKDMFITNIEQLAGYTTFEQQFQGYNMQDYNFYALEGGEKILPDGDGGLRINGNGSTIIVFEINRVRVDISIDIDDGDRIDDTTGEDEYVYGQEVELTMTTNPGYVVDRLELVIGDEILDTISGEELYVVENLDNSQTASYSFTLSLDLINEIVAIIEENGGEAYPLTAKWYSAVGEAEYTILIYRQTLGVTSDNGYTLYGEPIVLTGQTNSVIDYAEYTVSADLGYRLDHVVNGDNPTINGDESTVIEIYFNLNQVSFTIELGEGIERFEVNSAYGTVLGGENEGVYEYRGLYTDVITFTVDMQEGYIFDGIRYATEGSTIIDGSSSPEFSITLPSEQFGLIVETSQLLVWIYYNPNGADGEVIPSPPYSFGEEVTLRLNTFTRDGYEFLGWATSPNGEVVYTDGTTVVMGNNNLQLYAVWQSTGGGIGWWLWLIIALIILLIIIIIIIIIVKKKKDKDKEKIATK